MDMFQGHSEQITAIAWHPYKEDLFASSCHGGGIFFWKVESGLLEKIEKAHTSMIWDLAWHPSGTFLASSGNDHKMRYWGRMKPNEDINYANNQKNAPPYQG